MAITQKPATSVGVDLPAKNGRRGLALPIRASGSGGLRTSTGDQAAFERIATALGDDENRNAFRQEQSLGTLMIFDVTDPQCRARIRQRLTLVFDGFEREKRYKLLPETIAWTESAGTLELAFKYHDLESDEIRPFSKVFGSN